MRLHTPARPGGGTFFDTSAGLIHIGTFRFRAAWLRGCHEYVRAGIHDSLFGARAVIEADQV